VIPAYHFCAKCGGRLAAQEIEEQRRLVCEACAFVHYVNPRPTVAALVLDGDHVLLVRRAVEPRRGRVPAKRVADVPGGFLEVGEHPVVGLKRELREAGGAGGA
jgi:NADH pyrophosphatase NudC (nudix superfamily)